ncbi:hypothetical protein [Planococcus lenghuensis]|uniref:Uncharacterized protein n=1 Tax=Planococcus lenghuensis TaxID=2213202 RepID=A0A1Q2L313_9BACL|nr:hypothetical protein [Planococcus lenghuensis]AQQ54830.1 hypothetical protein B0X71_18135 [Planococcus lenghuensis]
MDYFIDHVQKKIHRKLYAGDRCGFLKTPVEQREFTASSSYVNSLRGEQRYSECPHCQSPPFLNT